MTSRAASMFAFGLGVGLCIVGCHRHAPRQAPQPRPATVASGQAPTGDDAALSHEAAGALATAFQSAGTPPTVSENMVRAAGREITVHARVAEVQEEDVTTAVVDVALEIDGHRDEAFHVPAVAIDRNRDEALHRAIREWTIHCAFPVVSALRAAAGNVAVPQSGATRIGSYDVFAGPIGTRGEGLPDDWSSQAVAVSNRLLSAMQPAIDEQFSTRQTGGFHGVRVTLHVRGTITGECDSRVDNVQVPRLCEQLQDFAWPRARDDSEGYVVKEYYLFAPIH